MVAAVFNEFAILLSLSVIVGFIAIKLRQPLILSFIIVGVIAGPGFLGWISSHSNIEVLASFGVTMLLFIVGLKLDIQLIKTFGMVTLIVGVGQILLTGMIGSLLGLMMGFAWAPSLFIGMCLTFSSTIIIIKLLSDRFEIDSLYGRISVGILIVQDLVVVIAIIVLSSLNVQSESYSNLFIEVISLFLKGIGFLALIAILMRFILPTVLEQLAASRELLILFAISWAVIFAVVADLLGFGKEVGGFLAGVSLASTHYREAITSRLETVRNLLLIFFFLNLGASLRFDALAADIMPAIVFSILVLFGKPFIVMILMGMMRFRKRTSFLAGMTMGQLSEFSLILAALAGAQGYIDDNVKGLITFVGLVTIGLSTYMMGFSNFLYKKLSPWLNIFERRVDYREDIYTVDNHIPVDVIIYGFGRHGEHMAQVLETYGLKTMGIDFDPRKAHSWNHHHILIRYGDAEDVEFYKTLPLEQVKWVISTIPHGDTNSMLVSSLHEVGYKGKIALSAYHEHDLEAIKRLNVDMMIVPYEDAALSAAQRIAVRIKSTPAPGTGVDPE